jgi:flavorubredoxin
MSIKALVLYHSQEHGNTKVMAEAVAAGLKEGGCDVEMFNTNEGRYDIKKFSTYKCVAIGSPDYYSYIAGGLKMFIDDHYIADVNNKMQGLKEKPFVLFCTHGGGGRVKEIMPRLFGRIGTQVGEVIDCMGKPDANIQKKCRELGNKLVEEVKKRK